MSNPVNSVDSPSQPPEEPLTGEAAWLHIQNSVQPATVTVSNTQQRFNAAGNAAFTAGSNVLAAKDMGDMAYSSVKKVLGDSHNGVLNNMVQLADKLVDLGKVVPIIAPAFVILKFIIDIEQSAREVDEKCQDLMERINFMVSHVLVLERIEIMDILRTVLQRVQDVLKEAAALIEAYRKQGKIARRLKMSNTQNFEAMAGKITTCSSDLMMSLQIQQTGDLSVLKRSVPRDLAAESFIKEHGGQDVINSNPALVKEFAEKMHLTMTDKVMEQMQSNMQELMVQNQHQIEDMIRETSSSGVATMIKAIAMQQREFEAERKLMCVQCEKEYFVSTNGPTSCGYHSGVGNFGRFNCCERSSPCQSGYHQPEHHSKYSYSTFFLWSHSLLGFFDTINYWANIRDLDLGLDNSLQTVRVGQLMRWRSGADPINTPLMLVNVGHVRDDLSFYLEIFDTATLEDERQKVIRTGDTRIFKNAPESDMTAYSMGEWVLDQETQQLTGIKFTVKVTNCTKATVCFVPIDPKTLKMPSGKSIEYLSKADTDIFKPDRPYEFPETMFLGPRLSETRLREPRTFKTKASPNLPLVLIPSIDMVANNVVMTARQDVDRFVGRWRALNKSPLANQNQIVLLSAKAEYRLVGEKEYRPVNYFGLRNNEQFPLSIAPMQTIDIPFEFLVDKPEAVVARKQTAINFAHLTIHHPLRVRITFTDMEGETVSLIQEYVHSPMGITRRKEEDIGYFYVDDIDLSRRTLVTVKQPKNPKIHIVDICGGLGMSSKISEMDLRKLVYKAEKMGVTQLDMGIGTKDLGVDWTAWALVDLSCKRVYGFKILLYHGSMTPARETACLGYCPCPLYGGDDLETHPIQYAIEEDNTPEVVYREPTVVIEDDTVDDDIPPPAPIVYQPAPVVQQHVPMVQQHVPIVQQHAPIVHQHAPIAQQHAPIVHQPAPIVQQHAPIVQQHAPIVQQHASIAQQHAPIAQQHAPIAQQHVPAVQQHASIAQQHAPIVHQHAPIAQQHAPTVHQPAPIVHQHAPIVQQYTPHIVQQHSPTAQQLSPAVQQSALVGQQPAVVIAAPTPVFAAPTPAVIPMAPSPISAASPSPAPSPVPALIPSPVTAVTPTMADPFGSVPATSVSRTYFPVTETAILATEAVAPVTMAFTPVVETFFPVAETVIPATETVAPVIETAIPVTVAVAHAAETETATPRANSVSTKTAKVDENETIIAVVSSSTPTSTLITPVAAPSNAAIDLLHAKIAALEARLEASERQDALMTKILSLEKKLEASTTTAPAAVAVAATAAAASQVDRVSVLENRLASMDQKLDSMNINLRLLDGNASRLAVSLEKIATLLAT
ncbi:hypothetical protein BGX27_010207 [Mortierella sp. AM989]|nr:hypothetical protein BGX27_010207 [Mortierella sp. AM989]